MAFVNTTDQMSEQEVLDGLIDHTLPELHDDKIVKLANYAFYYNDGIEVIDLPNCKTAGDNAFAQCTNLQSVNLPALTGTARYLFTGTTKKLGVVALPKVTRIFSIAENSYMAGFDFTNLQTIDYSNVGSFRNAYGLVHLVLRSQTVCANGRSDHFENTPIGNGYGYIYVPEDLVDDYKAATNWSAYADQILPIEGNYPKTYPGTIEDSWAQIFAAERDGSYRTKYQLGDTKTVMINGEPVIMQIVAMDTDVLASDNNQTAPITWISLFPIAAHRMNPSTTTIGGWGGCEMRSYLRDTVLPTIEETVRANIKEVQKSYRMFSPTSATATIDDTIWIPSARELGYTGSEVENVGAVYSGFFTDSASRVRVRGMYSSEGTLYSLRTAYNTNYFQQILNNGELNYTSGDNPIIFGFCT